MPIAYSTKIENPAQCKKCGGECCKTMGCHFAPSDFKEITVEYLSEKIDEGHISIDWWEGDPRSETNEWELIPEDQIVHRVPYLRMRNLIPDFMHPNSDFTSVPLVLAPIVDPSLGGICSMLTPTGCRLKYEERPRGGRMLVPNFDMNCTKNLYPKRQCVMEWLQYVDILEALIEKYI